MDRDGINLQMQLLRPYDSGVPRRWTAYPRWRCVPRERLPLTGTWRTDTQNPGDCSPVTREALFRHKVYAWRDRCSPCHFDDTTIDAPKWIATGPCELGSLQTMRNVLDRGLVDLSAPTDSLLLLKPLAESAGGVMHGGHDKFANDGDPAYVDFLAWIERESACSQ